MLLQARRLAVLFESRFESHASEARLERSLSTNSRILSELFRV